MALAAYQFTVTNDKGDIQPGAKIEVNREEGGLPSLFKDSAGTVPLGNPFTTLSGHVLFYVAGGKYRIDATAASLAKTFRDVGIGTMQEHDAEEYLSVVDLGTKLPIVVASRAALTALDTTKSTTSVLTEAGRAGTFVWRMGDFSDLVTADTAEGVYIKADAIAANLGAWVRDTDSVTPQMYGAKGDTVIVSDGAITATETTFESPSGPFTANDVGKTIVVDGAGAAAAQLTTTIASYTSATSVELTDAASTTVSGEHAVFGTDDTTAVQAAFSSGYPVRLADGYHMITSTVTATGELMVEGSSPINSGFIVASGSFLYVTEGRFNSRQVLRNFGIFANREPVTDTYGVYQNLSGYSADRNQLVMDNIIIMGATSVSAEEQIASPKQFHRNVIVENGIFPIIVNCRMRGGYSCFKSPVGQFAQVGVYFTGQTISGTVDKCSMNGFHTGVKADELTEGPRVLSSDIINCRDGIDLSVVGNLPGGWCVGNHLNVSRRGYNCTRRPDMSISDTSVYSGGGFYEGSPTTITAGAITSASTTLVDAGATFTASDVGKEIVVEGAGVSGADLSTTIDTFTNSTTVELTDAAGTTVAGATSIYREDDYDEHVGILVHNSFTVNISNYSFTTIYTDTSSIGMVVAGGSFGINATNITIRQASVGIEHRDGGNYQLQYNSVAFIACKIGLKTSTNDRDWNLGYHRFEGSNTQKYDIETQRNDGNIWRQGLQSSGVTPTQLISAAATNVLLVGIDDQTQNFQTTAPSGPYTYNLDLSHDEAIEGDIWYIRLLIGSSSDPTVVIRDGEGGAVLTSLNVFSFTRYVVEARFDGSAWVIHDQHISEA